MVTKCTKGLEIKENGQNSEESDKIFTLKKRDLKTLQKINEQQCPLKKAMSPDMSKVFRPLNPSVSTMSSSCSSTSSSSTSNNTIFERAQIMATTF